MAAAGGVLVKTLNLLRAKIRPGSPPGSWTRRRRSSSAPMAPSRRSRAIGAFPARSAPRRTRWWSTGFPGPTSSRAATSCRSTWAWCSTAGSPTPPGPSPWARSPRSPTACSRPPRAACSRPLSSAGRATAWATSRTRCRRASRGEGFSVVRSLVGHGIGRDMHEDPQIPNFGDPGKGPLLEEGMVLAVEPMVTAGRHAVRMGDDHWAIFSQDGSLAAHFEFTVGDRGRRAPRPHPLARRRQARGGLRRRALGGPAGPVSRPAGPSAAAIIRRCAPRSAFLAASSVPRVVAAAATAARAAPPESSRKGS